jgi:hypothetical protein
MSSAVTSILVITGLGPEIFITPMPERFMVSITPKPAA